MALTRERAEELKDESLVELQYAIDRRQFAWAESYRKRIAWLNRHIRRLGTADHQFDLGGEG